MCFRLFFLDGRVYIHHLNPQEKSLGLVLGEDFWGFAQAQAKTTEPGGATDSRGLSGSRQCWEQSHQASFHPECSPSCCDQPAPCAWALPLTDTIRFLAQFCPVLCTCSVNVIIEDILEVKSKGSRGHNLDK